MTNFKRRRCFSCFKRLLILSQANTSRSMMEAGRPGELHKKRLSRFDRRNLLKRHDLRGSLRWKRGQRSSSSSGFDDQQSLRHVLKADNLRVAQARLSPLRPAGVLIMGSAQGNGNSRTLRRSKNHPTKIKRSRTRLQLVLRETWY